MCDRHVKDFCFSSVLFIYQCATERPDLGARFGGLCSGLYFAAAPCRCAGGMQPYRAPYRELFSGFANTGKFTGIIIPV